MSETSGTPQASAPNSRPSSAANNSRPPSARNGKAPPLPPTRRPSNAIGRKGRSSTIGRASITGRPSASPAIPPQEALRLAKERVSYLENENKVLKEKLTGLRKAGAAMTRVVKPNTLPQIAKPPPPKDDPRIAELERALAAMTKAKDDMEGRLILKIDSLKGQLSDKIAQNVLYNNDINRLTAELTQKGEAKQPRNDDEIARLRAQVRELSTALSQAVEVRDKTIEMGRKAEMTTVMFMQQNASLEQQVQRLQQQEKVLTAALEEHGVVGANRRFQTPTTS